MSCDDLPLFQWRPPIKIIPFPSRHRIGHAGKVARQLAKARTNREADAILSKALEAHCRQMTRAGIAATDIEKERHGFKVAIRIECEKIDAAWVPNLEPLSSGTPRGAA
ncbi:hypothetical protein BTR14_20585 [Rhizobium rhizosphaerae]|uniref:Uncharacterized protein n=1 Tax=Xaviernesmea rhizosphaerae TaxID=1672749 RepID=A0ABX3P998_9HYPH|nr:DUF6074 family protein [Xaviernesmea rhizosphaerae]OQP84202.1 hypothetical protein BTR14_20585 [Xaviernesmea rhizosphaerae]